MSSLRTPTEAIPPLTQDGFSREDGPIQELFRVPEPLRKHGVFESVLHSDHMALRLSRCNHGDCVWNAVGWAWLGLGGYFGTGTSSLTALIPAAFGVGLTGLGVMARDAHKRKLG